MYILATIDCIDKRLTKDRPDLSSERAPHRDSTATLKKEKIWSQVAVRARRQNILIDWPSVAMWPWLDYIKQSAVRTKYHTVSKYLLIYRREDMKHICSYKDWEKHSVLILFMTCINIQKWKYLTWDMCLKNLVCKDEKCQLYLEMPSYK
jgi:hypothetical protein